MKLSDESVERFRVAYKESYGEEISMTDAREMASRVKLLYELLARPLPGEQEDHRAQEGDPPSSLPVDECSGSSLGTRDHPA